MANPFLQRATEYLREDEAFLSVVTPEPLTTYFKVHAESGRLYNQLAIVIGTPGSGKTTLARLFQYQTLATLQRNGDLPTNKSLVDTLSDCNAISDNEIAVVGARLPLESEYREFWELPYSEELRANLMIGLLQARTVLVWLRNLRTAGIDVSSISIRPRKGADAALDAIGGDKADTLLETALSIEKAIYKVSAALIPPPIEQIEAAATQAYRPFDVIESFVIKTDESDLVLKPLIIFDDAHSLHPKQFSSLKDWLSRREIRVGRWIQTRLDALTPDEVFSVNPPGSASSQTREITEIWMQTNDDRREQRTAFRRMARDMTSRYLNQMDVFQRRQIKNLGDILSTQEPSLSKSNLDELQASVDRAADVCNVLPQRREAIEAEVSKYMAITKLTGRDLHLAMTRILMHRYAKRTPQLGLFDESEENQEPNRPLKASASILAGANIHLLHEFNRPYYFGLDRLCDAASENAEQLLQLCAHLVAQSETNLIRRKGASLDPKDQNRILRQGAEKLIRSWEFPQAHHVRQICDGIASECLEKSLEPNAPLDGGAAGYGIPQEEFQNISATHPALARALKFGAAYNAFTLLPKRSVKNRFWCIVELGGAYRLQTGLTLNRGGFLERRTEDLVNLLEGS